MKKGSHLSTMTLFPRDTSAHLQVCSVYVQLEQSKKKKEKKNKWVLHAYNNHSLCYMFTSSNSQYVTVDQVSLSLSASECFPGRNCI